MSNETKTLEDYKEEYQRTSGGGGGNGGNAKSLEGYRARGTTLDDYKARYAAKVAASVPIRSESRAPVSQTPSQATTFAPFSSKSAQQQHAAAASLLNAPTNNPAKQNVMGEMGATLGWVTMTDAQRAAAIASANENAIIRQAESINKQYDEKMAAFNQANAAYEAWLQKNQSQDVINAMAVDPDAPEWVEFKAEGDRLYREVKKYDDEADALRLQADAIHDEALFITDMRRINELLPQMDAATRRAFDFYADTQLATGDFYQRMAALGVSEEDARHLAETWKRSKNKEGMEAFSKIVAQETRENYVGGNITSLASNVIAPYTGLLAASFAGLTGGRYRSADPNGWLFTPTVLADTVRETTAGDIRGENGNVVRSIVADAYNGAMGAADNILRTMMYGRKAEIVMAMDVYQRTVRNASVSGASKEQALALGLACAGLEYLTEQTSVDNMLDILKGAAKEATEDAAKKAAKKGFLAFLKQAGKNYIEELPQEYISFWGNAAAEAVILRQNSDFNRSVQNYMAEQAMSREEAEAAAWKDLLWDGTLRVAWDTGWSTLFQTGFATGVQRLMQKMSQDGTESSTPPPPDQPQAEDTAEKKTVTPTTHEATPLTDGDILEATLSGEPVGAAGTAQEALDAAVSLARQQGKVSNNQATRILQTPGAAELLSQTTGMELPGTASGNRAAIKAAVMQIAEAPEGSVTSESIQPPQTQEDAQTQELERTAELSNAEKGALELAKLAEVENYPGMEQDRAQENVQDGFAMGAADRNFSGMEAYNDALYDGNVQPARASDARAEEVPSTLGGQNVSGSAHNVINSGAIGEDTVDMLKREVAAGTFSYDTQTMESVVDQANDEIQSGGELAAYRSVIEAITRGQHNEHDLAKAQLLFLRYANDRSNPDSQSMAADMALAISEMSRSAGRQLNMAKLMRMLTPEGNLETALRVVQRQVDRINQGRSTADQAAVQIPQEVQDAFLDAVRDTMDETRARNAAATAAVEVAMQEGLGEAADAAVRQALDDAQAPPEAPTEQQESTPRQRQNRRQQPAAPLSQQIGERVAEQLARAAQNGETTEEELLFRTIMDFANEKAPRGRNGALSGRNLRTLRRYYENQAFFQEAWDAARVRVQQVMDTMAEGDPRRQRLEQFFNTHEALYRHRDDSSPGSILRKGTKEAATQAGYRMANAQPRSETVRRQLRDVLTENWQAKEEAAQRIAQVAMEGLELTDDAAREMANDIMNAFYADLAERGANKVAAMFDGETRQTVRKSMLEKLSELFNMGAFSNREYRQAAFDSVFGKDSGIDIPDQLMQRFVDSADEARSAAEDAIYMAAAAQIKSTFKEKYDSWRYMAMLGNVRTQARNVAGNVSFKGFVDAKRNLAAIAEHFLVKDRSQRTKSLLVGEEAKALLNWAKEDARSVAAQEAMEYNGWAGDRAQSKIEKYRQIFDHKLLELGRKGLKDLMSWEDMLSKRATYKNALASFLKARGITAASLLDGTADQAVVNEGRAYAVNEAMVATFNDLSSLAEKLVKIKGAFKGNSWVDKVGSFLIEGNLPFLRVPANIATRIWEYSPLGGVQTLITDIPKVRKGEVSAAQFIDKLAASTVGTGALVIGLALGKGIGGVKLIGSQPTEEEEAEGFKAWQLVIGDKGFDVQWLSPVIVPVFVGANMARLAGEDGDAVDQVTAAITALTTSFEPMLELSVLSNLKDLLSAGKYADSTGETFFNLAITAVTANVRQLIPTVFGHLERAGEPEKTQTYAEAENATVRTFERLLGDVFQKLPGDIRQVERLDNWGDPVDTRSRAAILAEDVFLPFSHTNRRTDATKREYLRVTGENIGELNENISYTTADGSKVDRRMTGKERDSMLKKRGSTVRDLIGQLLEDPVYQGMTQPEQQKAMSLVVEYATSKAKVETFEDCPWPAKWMAETPADEVVDQILTKAYGSITGGSRFSEDKHLEMVSAGVSDDAAKDVQSAIAALLPEPTYKEVRPIQQLEAILTVPGLDSAEKEAAIRAYLTDEQEATYDALTSPSNALKRPLTNQQYVATYRVKIDRAKGVTKDEFIKDLMEALGTRDKKLATQVYDIYYPKEPND